MYPWSIQSLGSFLGIISSKLLTSLVQSIMNCLNISCSQNLRVHVSKGTCSHGVGSQIRVESIIYKSAQCINSRNWTASHSASNRLVTTTVLLTVLRLLLLLLLLLLAVASIPFSLVGLGYYYYYYYD